MVKSRNGGTQRGSHNPAFISLSLRNVRRKVSSDLTWTLKNSAIDNTKFHGILGVRRLPTLLPFVRACLSCSFTKQKLAYVITFEKVNYCQKNSQKRRTAVVAWKLLNSFGFFYKSTCSKCRSVVFNATDRIVCVQVNKTGSVLVNIRMRRFRVGIVAVEKHWVLIILTVSL
jgi:hypothetical protein